MTVEEEKIAEEKAAAEKKAADEEAARIAASKPAVEIKDGKAIVDVDWYNNMTSDMKKYKGERNDLRESVLKLEKQIAGFADLKKQADDAKMLEDGKLKELLEQKEKEIVDMQTQFSQQRIDSALKTKALELGIKKADYTSLVDMSGIEINPDTEKITGIDETLKSFQESNPDLFGSETIPPTDPLKPGGIPVNLTWKMLMADSKLAVKVKKEDPTLYERLKQGRK